MKYLGVFLTTELKYFFDFGYFLKFIKKKEIKKKKIKEKKGSMHFVIVIIVAFLGTIYHDCLNQFSLLI